MSVQERIAIMSDEPKEITEARVREFDQRSGDALPIDGKVTVRKYVKNGGGGVMTVATSTKKMELTKSDLRRLRLFSHEHEFPKTASQENFAFEMGRLGLLERRWEMYSMSAGRKTAQYRWSYKLTPAGCAAIGEPETR